MVTVENFCIDENQGQLFWRLWIKYASRHITFFDDQVYLHMFLPYCIIQKLIRLFLCVWLKSKCNSKRARDKRFLSLFRCVCSSVANVKWFYIKIISGQVILKYLNSKQLTYWRRVDAYTIEGCNKLRDSPYDQFLNRFKQYWLRYN